TPVLDSTGLKDAYDFTLSFSSAGQLGGAKPPSSASANNDPSSAVDPTGGLSLPDAINKQLGVKMIKEKRPSPVLVIDHIEEKPTDN
ncbi:MAG TPA: TIGR03435 family protein, partial [Acidobacteriaceae bacterium]|nr:TIGR03435 family protein [Acidobacteriaceae bacterium]